MGIKITGKNCCFKIVRGIKQKLVLYFLNTQEMQCSIQKNKKSNTASHYCSKRLRRKEQNTSC